MQLSQATMLLLSVMASLSMLMPLASCDSYYITPAATTPCPEFDNSDDVPCITLSELATQFGTGNASTASPITLDIILLPGNHTLSSELRINNITRLSLQSYSLAPNTHTRIRCNDFQARFHLSYIDDVYIGGLNFTNCVENVIENVTQFVHEECTFVEGRGAALVLRSVTNATITRNEISLLDTSFFLTLEGMSGGGAAINMERSVVTFSDCTYFDNIGFLRLFGNVLSLTDNSNVTLYDTTIRDNGGESALSSLDSTLTIYNCSILRQISVSTFLYGGAIHAERSSLTIGGNSVFIDNGSARGGAVYIFDSLSTARIKDTVFIGNEVGGDFGARGDGGALYVQDAFLEIENCTFSGNIGGRGGAIYANNATVSSHGGTVFYNNIASSRGGAIATESSTFNFSDVTFMLNTASLGGAFYIEASFIYGNGPVSIQNNSATQLGAVYMTQSIADFFEDCVITGNNGSMFVFASDVIFYRIAHFAHNSRSQLQNQSVLVQEGGAITNFQSIVEFFGVTTLTSNTAGYGGAILTIEGSNSLSGQMNISHNTAIKSGGGVYSYQSDLDVTGDAIFSGNTALRAGGGIHAVSSTTRLISGSLKVTENFAERGGGISLDLNAKLYILKSQSECEFSFCSKTDPDDWLRIEFTHNTADYGGALYVDDTTISGTCAAADAGIGLEFTTNECFFQTLALHSITSSSLNLLNTHFANNSARINGSVLFGGLLDRCLPSPLSEIIQIAANDRFSEYSVQVQGMEYFLAVSNIDEENVKPSDVISSDPVRICFCNDSRPDCTYQPPLQSILRGGVFNISAVAVDQANNTVPFSVINGALLPGIGLSGQTLTSIVGGFGIGQARQNTLFNCTSLQYNVFSGLDSVSLSLHAEGPCNSSGISQSFVDVEFLPCECPIGFEVVSNQSSCVCDCDSVLSPFVSTCISENSTLLRQGSFWISYQNGIVLYPICPFDYCFEPEEKVYVNLNVPNGADAQCAFNRTGVLCGSCEDGLSLSLGSSRCMSCSNNWLALLLVFVVAGIALVAFLLMCNLTVAVGTINGLIFYANIVAANAPIFLPFESPNLLTVFIAWINLDFGFVTCFFDGMNGYTKIWLQFAFPVYIIILVAAIIIISGRSRIFSKLLSGKNPVATLSTLILLSYAKLLRTVIAAWQLAEIDYPDGSREKVWLVDANVPYLEGKHIPLFVAAFCVILLGVVYTFLLFFWQWILRCPNKRAFRWIRDTRLQSFMDAYHAPYNVKQRYWTGLLLLIRAVLYLISASNVLGNPSVNLLSIVSIVSGIQVIYILLGHAVYKKWLLNALEQSFVFNLIIFSVATYHVQETDGNQKTLAVTSISIAFFTFLLILCYHSYNFVFYKSCQKLKNQILKLWQKRESERTLSNPVSVTNSALESENFYELRGPLDLIEDDPHPEDYVNLSDSGAVQGPSSSGHRSPRVTHTVIEGIS